MSANDLALKFSTAPAEQLIGALPVLEVKEALHDEVEDEILSEVMMEHKFELEATEEITNAFATAMKLALTQPAKTAKATLRKALKEYPGYGQEPPAAP
ncbi:MULTISPECIES: hypothetical protein [Klebsiella]|uniref:hypothetical protein n=1 Tax=Klebsiella TaxID=570 RepID=UPI000D6508F9|nr:MULTISPECIES: hypothetical protein [Klebsiella]HCB9076699.1 hypothetical protein [Klebsiella pneumoniae]EGT0066830.1 hypothetical protein [Klebsiella michiganensis]EKP1128730.1 hypothetical protein [Klebsiella michiganensis]MBE0159242.1 hypothetical protein [Klebsiella michiganensis]MBE0170513.1 hypothetical protein [Klebsiella michiganensis]